jgi:hypothetical protein
LFKRLPVLEAVDLQAGLSAATVLPLEEHALFMSRRPGRVGYRGLNIAFGEVRTGFEQLCARGVDSST